MQSRFAIITGTGSDQIFVGRACAVGLQSVAPAVQIVRRFYASLCPVHAAVSASLAPGPVCRMHLALAMHVAVLARTGRVGACHTVMIQ